MTRKRSRIDGLRMPFVVTVTLATGACGGTTVDHGSGDGTGDISGSGGADVAGGAGGAGNASGSGTGAGPSGSGGTVVASGGTGPIGSGGAQPMGYGGLWNPPFPSGCPASVPASGSLCMGVDVCSYPNPDSCLLGAKATCVAQAWNVEALVSTSSCNPPPPRTTVCPVTSPSGGEYCYYMGPGCQFGDCASGTSFSCVGNAWIASESHCLAIPTPGVVDAGPADDAGGAAPDGG